MSGLLTMYFTFPGMPTASTSPFFVSEMKGQLRGTLPRNVAFFKEMALQMQRHDP
ncbi:hypothetical protein [Mesorhizobium sp.]|uniref:hypothetical protein n=1 Tax=Mesorhizobium sp. TaxID=1871066 RepID=UPI0025E1073B|nr:hypothetical protein [Mesorhizobium sp.]